MEGTQTLSAVTTSGPPKTETMSITSQEEKEMMRVFELLCDYQQKTAITTELEDLKAHVRESRESVSNIEEGSRLANSIEAAGLRIKELEQTLHETKSNPNKKISCNDLMETFKFLSFKVTKKEVEEMLWEVDEDLDGFIVYNEFKLMFNRNIQDKTGLEPNRLFNLVQFLIYDTNENGMVSVDETMNLLYARYGRSKMEVKLKELFGEDMHETGQQGGEISFTKYVNAVTTIQLHQFLSTTKGRIANARGFMKTNKSKNSKSHGH